MNELKRNTTLSRLFVRPKEQLNKINISDAELLRLDETNSIMAISTDIICEEIEFGLYSDPYHMGWMAVMVNATDICAVGALPKYLLLNETFNRSLSQEFISLIQKGIADACKSLGIFVIGGDTNYSNYTAIGGTAIGFVSQGSKYVVRVGLGIGDVIFTTGNIGAGNFYGLAKLLGTSLMEPFYPNPREECVRLISKYASGSIDTSDGLFTSLYTLMTLNNVGVQIERSVYLAMPPNLMEFCKEKDFSPLLFMAGIMGEYELVFTVARATVTAFLEEARSKNVAVHEIGRITDSSALSFVSEAGLRIIDMEAISELSESLKGDLLLYVDSLQKILTRNSN